MSQPKLILEILSGPLDGQVVTLAAETEWRKTGDGPLSFPWDAELGTPQAHFTLVEGTWLLAPVGGTRNTRRNGEPVKEKVLLAQGDWLKAADTWLLVKQIEQASTS